MRPGVVCNVRIRPSLESNLALEEERGEKGFVKGLECIKMEPGVPSGY